MYEIGRLCAKIAGRDAGMQCIIIDVIDKNNVMIDGQTRRRKCNIKHLEPLRQVLKIAKNASHTEIIRVFKGLKLEIKETEPKKKDERPKKIRKKKEKPVKQPAKQLVKEPGEQSVAEKPAKKPKEKSKEKPKRKTLS